MRRFETLGITDARQQMNIFGQTGIFGQVENGEITTDEFCRLLALEAQQKGGKFVPGARSLRISAQMENLPDDITIDITKLDLDKKIKAGDVKVEKVSVLISRR